MWLSFSAQGNRSKNFEFPVFYLYICNCDMTYTYKFKN